MLVAYTVNWLFAAVPVGGGALAARAAIAGSFALGLAGAVWIPLAERPWEYNKEAVQYIASQAKETFCLFLHGGVIEQFAYYRQKIGFAPSCTYVGSTDWPCCERNMEERANQPQARSFQDDLVHAVRTHPNATWLLFLPSGEDGHWSVMFGDAIRAVPRTMRSAGCLDGRKSSFQQTLVWRFECRNRRVACGDPPTYLAVS